MQLRAFTEMGLFDVLLMSVSTCRINSTRKYSSMEDLSAAIERLPTSGGDSTDSSCDSAKSSRSYADVVQNDTTKRRKKRYVNSFGVGRAVYMS